jgi:hypothetical protein
MAFLTLMDIERAVRASWGQDTYPPDEGTQWDPGNPARGQCGVVAVVLNDILGGELMRGEVLVDGDHVVSGGVSPGPKSAVSQRSGRR